MPELSAIDELNKPISEEIDFYAEYFGVMDLPDKEIEERIELANKFETIFNFILALILADSKNEEIQEKYYYTNILYTRYTNVVSTYYNGKYIDDEYVKLITEKHIDSIIEETLINIHTEYYTSVTRSMNISANESNSIADYNQFVSMVEQGFTKKVWKTTIDGKERKIHKDANNQIVDIQEPFKVGGELLMFPHDESLGASEKNLIHCRCAANYF